MNRIPNRKSQKTDSVIGKILKTTDTITSTPKLVPKAKKPKSKLSSLQKKPNTPPKNVTTKLPAKKKKVAQVIRNLNLNQKKRRRKKVKKRST